MKCRVPRLSSRPKRRDLPAAAGGGDLNDLGWQATLSATTVGAIRQTVHPRNYRVAQPMGFTRVSDVSTLRIQSRKRCELSGISIRELSIFSELRRACICLATRSSYRRRALSSSSGLTVPMSFLQFLDP